MNLLVGAEGEGCGQGTVKEFGMGMYILLYLKWITNKVLLYSTENSAQSYIAAWIGGKLRDNVCTFM